MSIFFLKNFMMFFFFKFVEYIVFLGFSVSFNKGIIINDYEDFVK